MFKDTDQYISMPSPIECELRNLFGLKDPLTIFDIGSCEGEESIKHSKLFRNSKIYAVEALPDNLELIKLNL
jgi:2-O-methyltransferase